MKALRDRLLAGQSAAGGWPYYANKAPRIEPTVWALLALSSLPPGPAIATAIDRGWTWLASIQQPSGLLLEPGVPTANYGWNGLALIAATASTVAAAKTLARPVSTALVGAKGRAFEGDRSVIDQDSSLQAWSWVENTFSWVEPTAYCLIGLKRLEQRSASTTVRTTEGEAVLLDRVCEVGGWNYGNSNVLGQDLRPYVPTTALGVLAMGDRLAHPAVARSLQWLEKNAETEKSAIALSLASTALHACGRPFAGALAALEAQDRQTSFLSNSHLVASALHALTLPTRTDNPFMVRAAA